MYNVEKLEEQWGQYRRKKILYPVALTVVVTLVILALVYTLNTDSFTEESNASVMISPVKNDENISSTIQKGLVQEKKIGRIESLATEVPSLGVPTKDKSPKVGQIIFQDSEQAAERKVKKRKNLLIQVTERGNKDIAIDIENRFEFAKDKSDSLFLAKYYYDKMDYEKAEKWALETNKLDNTIEESWLIFAKAQARQGKRIEALKVLKAFLDQSGSLKAKNLINKIRRGKRF